MRRIRRPAATLVAVLSVAGLAVSPVPSATAATTGPTLSVDVAAVGPSISPDVYGASFPTPAFAAAARIGLARWGGNSTTRYDYRTDDYNTANDWYFENHVWDGGAAATGGASALDSFVSTASSAGQRAAVTVPVLGYVAKDATSCGFPTTLYSGQQSTDYWQPTCGNGNSSGGNPLAVTHPATQTSKAFGTSDVTAMASHLALHTTTAPTLYQLDNEPSLWNSTHRDVQPSPVTGSQLFSRSTSAADAILAGDPSAVITGPGDWGWCAYFWFPADNCSDGADRAAHGGLDLGAAYLKAFHDHDVSVGHRTLAVLDEHFYPQGNGVALSPAGDAATQALRLRSKRALWDPTYVDESWIGTTGVDMNVELIPRMRQWVQQQYPGTGLAIGEYNFGGLESMNGALAQADVLGILGREGVSWAALWDPPTTATDPGTFAFRMFRNLDGHGAGFGTTSVRATSSDQSQLSTYAATRADGTVTVVVVNKTAGDLTSPLTVSGATLAPTATVYRYSPADLTHIATSTVVATPTTTMTFPAQSITTIVMPRASAGPALGMATSATTVTYATKVTLTAYLTDSGAPVVGAPVGFYARPRGSANWTRIATRTTGATGTASIATGPGAATEYSARDLRTGVVLAVPTATTVLVRRAASLSVSRSKVRAGASVTFSGAVAPAAGRLAVTLQRLVSHRWVSVGHTVLSRNHYSLASRPPRGRQVYRVVVAADASRLSAVSPQRVVSAT